MSEIKFPPLPDELNKDVLRSIAWDFAKAAVALNAPQVPEDEALDALIGKLLQGPPTFYGLDAAKAITALRQYNASIRDYVSGAATIAALKERLDRAEAERDQLQKQCDALHTDLANARTIHASEVGGLSQIARRLEEERDALRADADRYRWLRSNFNGRLFAIEADSFHGDTILMDEQLDAAIDAARGK